MRAVNSTAEVFEAIQSVKSAASAFSTNFFPVQQRLEAWIEHQELFLARSETENVVFFFRKDRDFFHLYFCAPSATALASSVQSLPEGRQERLSADVVGQQAAALGLAGPLEQSGFRKYSQLVRLSRVKNPADIASNPTAAPVPAAAIAVELAREPEAPRILELLEASFDRLADQLPFDYEILGAIAQQQIFVIRSHCTVAAFLHFETQGLSSTLRFWVVGQPFRASGFGSMLVRHYFASQTAVRRFILWVNAGNENALQKYAHYGYAPDGLVDHILVNSLIPR